MPSLVSVIIPCYNSVAWISDAIESCLEQTYRPLEVIVVDDGSTDGSTDLIYDYAYRFPQLVRFHVQRNQGGPVARNRGASLAKGDFLFFLDADDRLRQNTIERLVKTIELGSDIAYGNISVINASGRQIATRDMRPRSSDWVIVMLSHGPITSSILFRREVVQRCLWDSSLPCAQDVAYRYKCALEGFSFAFTPDIVADIREHDSPTRITHIAQAIMPEIVYSLIKDAERELMNRGDYSYHRKQTVQLCYLDLALRFRQMGKVERAKEIFAAIEIPLVRKAPEFRYLSRRGIAVLAGVTAADYARRLNEYAGNLFRLATSADRNGGVN